MNHMLCILIRRVKLDGQSLGKLLHFDLPLDAGHVGHQRTENAEPSILVIGAQRGLVLLELSPEHVQNRLLHKDHVLGLDLVQDVTTTEIFHEFLQFLVILAKHTERLFNHLDDETGVYQETFAFPDVFDLGRRRETKERKRFRTLGEQSV